MTRPTLQSLPDGRIIGRGPDFLVSGGGGLTVFYNGGAFISECIGNPDPPPGSFPVSAGSLVMEDNTTNYVCIDFDGVTATVVTNTSGCSFQQSLAIVVTAG